MIKSAQNYIETSSIKLRNVNPKDLHRLTWEVRLEENIKKQNDYNDCLFLVILRFAHWYVFIRYTADRR